MDLPPVDLVAPLYNEAAEVRPFLESLAAQTAPPGLLRVILVDSESTDGTQQAVEACRAELPGIVVVLLQEPERNHVEARRRGAEFALSPGERERSPILVSADVDTRFHPDFVADVGRRLGGGALDAVTYAGHYPAAFWDAVPRLARRYYEEVGTVFFPRATIERRGFSEREALFTEQLFFDFPRVPSDCAWAYTKDAYERAGGYRREWFADGREVVFEGRNLRFRLDRIGARIAYANATPFETSPRRLVREAERLLAGEAYAGGLTHLRGEVSPEQLAVLDELAAQLDFEALRRYVVKHYVLLPVVTRPSLLAGRERYFGEEAEALRAELEGAEPDGAAAVHQAADALLDRCFEGIVRRLRAAR